MESLLSGLVGAVIGALFGGKAVLVAAGREIRANTHAQRREELRAVVADFWAGCDALWIARRDLGWTIYEMVDDRDVEMAVREQREQRRQQAFADIREASRRVGAGLALIRILFDDLHESAEVLASSSNAFKVNRDDPTSRRQELDRQRDLERFEAQVRHLLNAAA